MYTEHFGLQEPLAQDGIAGDDRIFRGQSQSAIITELTLAMSRANAVVLIYGKAGTGKSTLAACATRESSTQLSLGCLSDVPHTEHELLEQLLLEFGFSPYRMSRTERLSQWRQHLAEMAATGTRVAILAENADRMSTAILVELERLTSADIRGITGANLLLTAREPIAEIATADSLIPLRQRCRAVISVNPLTVDETDAYLRFCIERAGGQWGAIADDDIVPVLHEASGGMFRTIDNLFDASLALAAREAASGVTREIVERVVSASTFVIPAMAPEAAPTPSPDEVVATEGPAGDGLPTDVADLLDDLLEDDARLDTESPPPESAASIAAAEIALGETEDPISEQESLDGIAPDAAIEAEPRTPATPSAPEMLHAEEAAPTESAVTEAPAGEPAPPEAAASETVSREAIAAEPLAPETVLSDAPARDAPAPEATAPEATPPEAVALEAAALEAAALEAAAPEAPARVTERLPETPPQTAEAVTTPVSPEPTPGPEVAPADRPALEPESGFQLEPEPVLQAGPEPEREPGLQAEPAVGFDRATDTDDQAGVEAATAPAPAAPIEPSDTLVGPRSLLDAEPPALQPSAQTPPPDTGDPAPRRPEADPMQSPPAESSTAADIPAAGRADEDAIPVLTDAIADADTSETGPAVKPSPAIPADPEAGIDHDVIDALLALSNDEVEALASAPPTAPDADDSAVTDPSSKIVEGSGPAADAPEALTEAAESPTDSPAAVESTQAGMSALANPPSSTQARSPQVSSTPAPDAGGDDAVVAATAADPKIEEATPTEVAAEGPGGIDVATESDANDTDDDTLGLSDEDRQQIEMLEAFANGEALEQLSESLAETLFGDAYLNAAAGNVSNQAEPAGGANTASGDAAGASADTGAEPKVASGQGG